MRIAYLVQWDIHREDGVLKKISRQLHGWQEAGNQVRLFAFTPNQDPSPCLKEFSIQTFKVRTPVELFWVPPRAVNEIMAWHPDLVYMRFNKYYPSLGKITSYVPMILEINTNDLEEFRYTTSPFIYLYHILTRDIILNKCSGMIFLGEETARFFDHYKKPSAVIGDSVNLDGFPIYPPARNEQPHLVFMASHPAKWHGMDKLIWLAGKYPKWRFEVIGLKEVDHPGKTPPNMVHHGYLGQKDYESIMGASDIAISALALHRIGININAPLKLREYLACGLPSIIAHRDTDFPQGAQFLLQLPNTERNVMENHQIIEDFVLSRKGSRVPRESIAHLDSKIKEQQRLEFFREVIKRSH